MVIDFILRFVGQSKSVVGSGSGLYKSVDNTKIRLGVISVFVSMLLSPCNREALVIV